MKNKTDLSERVMDQVVQYEERSARSWRVKFFVILAGLLAVLAAGVYVLIQYYSEYQLFALFDLFKEDWEIISEYWQDTLSTVWDETPKEIVYLALCMCVMIVVYLLITRHKRNILKKKMQQISAYRSKTVR